MRVSGMNNQLQLVYSAGMNLALNRASLYEVVKKPTLNVGFFIAIVLLLRCVSF